MCLCFNNLVFLILVAIKMAHSINDTDRIVGGTQCRISDYPFLVSLRYTYTSRHFCGGALISKKWVISAAHCMTKVRFLPWLLTAVVGETRSDQRTSGQFIRAHQIFSHNKFDGRTLRNDISLVLLKSDVDFVVGMIEVIHLPNAVNLSEDLTTELNGQLSIAGWGSTEIVDVGDQSPQITSRFLRCVNVSYITYEECYHLSWFATREHICTFSQTGGEDSCKGDSGGPLFHERTIYGIVSWSHGCGMPGRPSFNTRVDKYLDFINSTMRACSNRPILLDSILIFLIVIYSLA
ncbi:hypothetical protein WA026_011635 [Henosepilachna vigintioctopunctata]|uniref:Peptidase S1 domain-containing protein n=1 Tax=Henosepilachna vigintioctopunctata TaxID=420089 RepID=A0AAW1TRS5_9CUCU